MPDQLANPTWWDTLSKIFGPGGLALLLAFGAALYGIKLLWERLKEKDAECQKEMDQAEVRWETRFQQMRGDVKEGFGIVAALTQQVTLLTAKK